MKSYREIYECMKEDIDRIIADNIISVAYQKQLKAVLNKIAQAANVEEKVGQKVDEK